jgi:hypothetical protein
MGCSLFLRLGVARRSCPLLFLHDKDLCSNFRLQCLCHVQQAPQIYEKQEVQNEQTELQQARTDRPR